MQLIEHLIQERVYLKGVSPKTVIWYHNSFNAFDGALESEHTIMLRSAEVRTRGVSAIPVNAYLRCVNAYLRWLHVEHGRDQLKIPRLKEEQKILNTFSQQHIDRLLVWKPRRSSDQRLHCACLSVAGYQTGVGVPGATDHGWVFLDGSVAPELESVVDLSIATDRDGKAWVGFTASTGWGWQNHDILSWSFAETDVSSGISVVSSDITFPMSACLPVRRLCTPERAFVEKSGKRYRVVLPANIEWDAGFLSEGEPAGALVTRTREGHTAMVTTTWRDRNPSPNP